MEPVIPDLRFVAREEAYSRLLAIQYSVLEGSNDVIAGMATISALLHHSFGHLWTGFYRVVEPEWLLRVGPYQGSLGCQEIEFGRGVCGTAAAERRTVIVPDVLTFPGHITCDAGSRSEMVVPVFDAYGALLAVLDIDSAQPDRFDEQDERGVVGMVAWFAGKTYVPTPA